MNLRKRPGAQEQAARRWLLPLRRSSISLLDDRRPSTKTLEVPPGSFRSVAFRSVVAPKPKRLVVRLALRGRQEESPPASNSPEREAEAGRKRRDPRGLSCYRRAAKRSSTWNGTESNTRRRRNGRTSRFFCVGCFFFTKQASCLCLCRSMSSMHVIIKREQSPPASSSPEREAVAGKRRDPRSLGRELSCYRRAAAKRSSTLNGTETSSSRFF